ncbi:LPXTG-domain-containing protein cell wall anchor protein [Gemella morbillorum M424]|uniref:Spy0128 family protein n=1 Tax=Gemella morbillorum TaxID=29391 RepID=UPI0001EFF3DA|nr:FctA domain-containing protein [Gemella morbillorum]EFV34709.1 LPXTG-domain-containing protein cell wall anchor protein [Gemella morbillorum M424]
MTKKELAGKNLEDNEFTFVVKEGTKVVGTAKNKADGTVTFNIEYKEAGTHNYKLTEVNEGKDGYTYDNASYDVKVEVTDNGGQLEAKVTGDNVTFTNKYNKPDKPATETPDGSNDPEPKKTLPNTGATDSPVLPGLLGLVLIAVSAFLYRARNNN